MKLIYEAFLGKIIQSEGALNLAPFQLIFWGKISKYLVKVINFKVEKVQFFFD